MSASSIQIELYQSELQMSDCTVCTVGDGCVGGSDGTIDEPGKIYKVASGWGDVLCECNAGCNDRRYRYSKYILEYIVKVGIRSTYQWKR